jgi:O-antigen/teichoic acid export membrane protein
LNLKQQTFSAVRWTTFAMVFKSGLQFAQVAVLSRLLAPTDFGLMAMVLAVMVFVQVFTDLGVSNAIIHHQDISANQLSSLYWLNVTVGAVLMLTLMAFSGGLGALMFNQPDLQPVLFSISASILLVAAGQQLRVMAEKSLRFTILAKVEIAAALAGFIAAIWWAWISPSVYALVAGVMVNSLVQTLLLWLFAADGWRPAFRLRLSEIRHFLNFGGYMMANNFINSFNAQADVLIAGRLFPAATLGIYSLPRSLSLSVAGSINPVITRVGLPVMAKAQHDKSVLKSIYLKTMRMTASINFPIYIALAVFSKETVVLLFGLQWTEAAPLLVYLAIWGMFRSCGNPVGSLLLAVGRADLSFKWNLALLFVIPPALWASSHWGIAGLAIAQAALMATLMIPAWYFLVWPHCGARAGEYAQSMLGPLAAALLAVALAYLAVAGLTMPHWRLCAASAVAIPLYFAMSYLFNREWLIAMRQMMTGK